MDSDQQLTLFSTEELKSLTAFGGRRSSLQMDCEYFQQWKAQIHKHQQQMRMGQMIEQVTLFDLSSSAAVKPEMIDPFALSVHSFSFFRFPNDGPGEACLYFVLDSAAEVILYIGETCRSHKRWRGQHDCKIYLDNYTSMHYHRGIKTAVNIAFWWGAPANTRARQQLELSLIQKWRSPFNKENWTIWGRPFG